MNEISSRKIAVALVLLFSLAPKSPAAPAHALHGHVPAAVAQYHLNSLGRLPATQRLRLVIGLPLRNQESMDGFIQQLYNPRSTNFHHYLNPAQFTQQFGPTEEDYQKVINFAKSNNLEITSTSDDRVLLSVAAPVGVIETAFHVHLLNYQHPAETRQFFAPDVEPTVDETVPIIFITGLNNFIKPHPSAHQRTVPGDKTGWGGTAPNGSGSFMGQDFRNAYASGVSATGSGQMVGLVEFEGYYSSDMTAYENAAGITTSFPIQNVTLPDWGGINTSDVNGIQECSLDIEMIMSMAPGLSKLYVFEGGSEGGDADTMLKYMSSSNQVKQFSSSWAMGEDPMAEGYLMKMAMQGQSFMMDAGDGDAYVVSPSGDWPADDPYITSCGGTTLTMTSGAYTSETVWNWHLNGPNPWCCNGQTTNDPYWGSGGGVSTVYSIPLWQQGVNTTAVGGSSSMRNLPDVAMTADQVWIYANKTYYSDIGGTSVAAPLWAGFTALANETAANEGLTSLGFLNPALYAIGEGPLYNSAFHDITNGNDFWPSSPSKYNSAVGYDLCTGWGTPNGIGLVDALLNYGSAVWVDFNYTGSPQNGTYDNPYETMAQATSAVPSGGNIWIRTAGSTSATMTITKPMTIHAYNGAGTIGN